MSTFYTVSQSPLVHQRCLSVLGATKQVGKRWTELAGFCVSTSNTGALVESMACLKLAVEKEFCYDKQFKYHYISMISKGPSGSPKLRFYENLPHTTGIKCDKVFTHTDVIKNSFLLSLFSNHFLVLVSSQNKM